MIYCDCDCEGCEQHHNEKPIQQAPIGRDDASGETTRVSLTFQQKPKNARFRIGAAMADLEGGTEDATDDALTILQGIYDALTEQHAERVD